MLCIHLRTLLCARYTVCRCNSLVTQIRLDFTLFSLAPPFTCGKSTTSVACTITDGPLIGGWGHVARDTCNVAVTGDCIYDTFTVTTPGSSAPPVICGYNTGQHMYVPSR